MPGPEETAPPQGTDTCAASRQWSGQFDTRIPTLTLIAHPDRRRVGARALLSSLVAGREARLGRSEPGFAQPAERLERPLESSRVSRSPIRMTARGGQGDASTLAIELDGRNTATLLEVDGQLMNDRTVLNWQQLERGIVLCLSRHIVLLFHLTDPLTDLGLPSYGLVGASDAIVRVRSDIRRLASLDVPVLLRGETGTGKELVAAALHNAGKRSGGPLVAINMAAIPQSLAASELFGAAKGAYTGSTRDRRGAFRRAHGGTLFLDEVGDAPEEIQALLLRTLENSEVQPVGTGRTIPVDIRLITATDLDLESAIGSGRFRSPLFYRVAGYEIHLPPLRDRREDFGRLFFHFLKRELEAMGKARPEDAGDRDRPWPRAQVIARLAGRPWPGNVRQLRNAVRQLAILGPEATPAELRQWLESAGTDRHSHTAESSAPSAPLPPAPPPRRR